VKGTLVDSSGQGGAVVEPNDGVISAHVTPDMVFGTHEVTTWGHNAVILFFVLSGYLVGGSVIRAYRSGAFDWVDYAIQRLVRLWVVLVPGLIVGLCIDAIGARLSGGHGLYASWKGIVPALRDDAGNLFFLQTILVPPAGTNSALWSLAYEFWYYVSFPLIVFSFCKGYRPSVRIAMCVGLAGVAWLMGPRMDVYFVFWLLGAGIHALPGWKDRTFNKGLLYVSAAIYLAIVWFLKKVTAPLYVIDSINAVTFACLTAIAVRTQGSVREGVLARVIEHGSAASYTLYLFHLPLVTLLMSLLVRPFKPYSSVGQAAPYIVVILLSAMIFSHVMYVMFEANTARVRDWVRHLRTT